MPFYLRKSINVGPFRFNLSKSGVGLSTGVRGFRIGSGPRGHYIHAGANGIYYRSSLGKNRRTSKKEEARLTTEAPHRPISPTQWETRDANMVEVESGDVSQMIHTDFTSVLDEINHKHRRRRRRMFEVFAILGGVLGFFGGLLLGPMGLFGIFLAIPGYFFGKWLDNYRRPVVLFYNLEADTEDAYTRLTEAFDALVKCDAYWHIESGGKIFDDAGRKRNAGATYLVERKPTTLGYATPEVIVSNVSPPAMAVGRQTIYFLPDAVLIKDASRIGAIGYSELEVRYETANFVEDGAVPFDTAVVGETWRHPNRDGGPDRRFLNNDRLPICRYDTIHLTSHSGLNELVQFSCPGVTENFKTAIREMAVKLAPDALRTGGVPLREAPRITL
ncbi:hypothetical protein LCGC14_0510720 [marine sediment metagenome]|uniref:DUF4236 domain-containing protein n=1 Tax=marine sediment metagenome TaxID=412755 RepID=A0A0F9S193_9ZZZZ